MSIGDGGMEVVDFLHLAGQRYKDHLHMLRSRRDAQEMEGFTGRPTISPFAAEYSQARDKFHKASGSLVVVQDRLHSLHKRKLERSEAAKQKYEKEVETRDMVEVTLKPKITQRAQSLTARGTQAEVTAKWLDEHNKRLQHLHEEALVREMHDVQSGPIVAPYSAELAKLRRSDPNSSRFEEDVKQRRAAGSIADYLLAKDGERQLRLKMKAAESELSSGHSFHPQISRRAHSSRSSMDVTERLLKNAEEKRNTSAQYIDDHCTFIPVVSDASRRIVDRMRDSSGDRSSLRQSTIPQPSFKPEINAVSRKLADDRKNRRTDMDLSSVRKSSRASSVSEESPLQPKISERSRAMAQDHYDRLRSTIRGGDTLSNDELRLVAAERALQRRTAAAARQREMKAAAEASECTFQPRLSIRSGDTPAVTEEDVERFYDRNRLWTSRRDHSLQHQRQLETTKEVEECTFQPRIHDQVPLPAAARNPSSSTVSVLAPGATTFLKRMEDARARKAEADRRKNGKPASTRPLCGFTTPVPFLLGKDRDSAPNTPTPHTHQQWSDYRDAAGDQSVNFHSQPPRPTPVDFVLGNHNQIAHRLHSAYV